MARRRGRAWHLTVVGAPPLPHAAPRPAGRRREGPPARQPVRHGPTPAGPGPPDGDPQLVAVRRPRRGPSRAPQGDDLPRPRLRDALQRARLAASPQRRHGPRKGPCDGAAVALRARVVAPPAQDVGRVRPITISTHTADLLAKHLVDRPDGDDELVYTTTAGTPLQHASFQPTAGSRRSPQPA